MQNESLYYKYAGAKKKYIMEPHKEYAVPRSFCPNSRKIENKFKI